MAGAPALFAFQSAWLADESISADNIRSVVSSAHSLTIGSPDHRDLPIASNALDFVLPFRHASVPRPAVKQRPFHYLSKFAKPRTLGLRERIIFDSGETTYPVTRDNETDICFAVPWLRLGVVEQCVLKFAEALKRSVKSVRLHLLVTEGGMVDFDRTQLSVFDEIVSVAHCELR